MAGNVWEWVSDWYASDYYQNGATNNPTGPTTGNNKVLRGGSWSRSATILRSAYRNVSSPTVRRTTSGFVVSAQASELLGFWVLFFWGVQGGTPLPMIF
jgi:formylglycine-generating enzyme